jgi:hypothetical protein
MRPFLAELPRFSRAFLVMKTNQVPAWAAWVLRCRPEALVVHVVRHPGGVIRAWRARYAGAQPSPSLVSESRSRLRRVFQADPRWASRIGDPQRMDPVEAEVWFWRYGTQLIHEAGLRSRSYLLVKDEDVWSEPSAVAGQIYARCGLETGAALEAWLAGMAESWRAHTAPWRSGLAATDIRSVERVLDDDLFAGWWTPGQKVSDSSYRAY